MAKSSIRAGRGPRKESSKQQKQRSPLNVTIAVVCLLILFRVMIGYQPHSGQDDWHGLHSAYGGDFEAQRHWMELTLHLPIKEWYWYDLNYWGLDYPPLSAYVSYVCGWLSHRLVGPESVALETSRGYEDATHKAFMRATVIVLDLTIYGTAVWYYWWKVHIARRPPLVNTDDDDDKSGNWQSPMSSFILSMMQPAILIIDHGHFQYNTVSLGLSLWSFLLVSREDFGSCLLGSVCFCLALSFKQMTLYYAPAIFFYLLGRCFQDKKKLLVRFTALGATVLITMGLLWWPFVVWGPEETSSYTERAAHVFRRIIPLQRGLFEGKVANLWCALSTKPIRIRDRIPSSLLPAAALLATLSLAAPSCYRLFQLGSESSSQRKEGHSKIILYGMTSSALSFFLASFQVHEKSLLLAVAPLSLLLEDDALFVNWFAVIATWTLWPLLVIDRLQVAYFCTLIVFVQLSWFRSLLLPGEQPGCGFMGENKMLRQLVYVSGITVISLHCLECVITLPPHLPDLFPVLWSIVGCAFCCLAWMITCWHMYIQHKIKYS